MSDEEIKKDTETTSETEKQQEELHEDATKDTENTTEPRVKDEQALKDIDVEWESEKLCRWAAARAGVVVLVPFLGSMSLIANEIYMISRLADLRGIKLTEGAVAGLLGGLGATFVGQTVMTIIPFAPIQVPLAISITYGVGKAATAWIKAGHPEDVAAFREIFEKARKEGMEHVETFKNMHCKDTPLGDESKRFNLKEMKENLKDIHLKDLKDIKMEDVDVKANDIFNKVKIQADTAESVLTKTLEDLNVRFLGPLKEHGSQWVSAQHLDKLSKGELVIPYTELKMLIIKALQGSDFTLLDIGFETPERVALLLQHKKYGTLKLVLSVLDFYVDSAAAKAHLKVEDFDIPDNDFASLVVETIGDKLIFAILDLAFDKMEMKDGGVVTTYKDRIISVDCHEMLAASKISQKKLMGKSLLDVLHLVNLTPELEGLKLKANVSLRK
jgi:uncharacterized protein (DUF697 family)